MRSPFFLTCLALTAVAHADVNYQLRVLPSSKSFAVKMEITKAGLTENVRIPAWCPGFYFLLDYQKRITDINALDPAGNRLKSKKIDDKGFTVDNPAGTPITITYRVSGNDSGLGFFRTHVRSTSAFVNGPGAFMYADAHKLDKCQLKIDVPAGWDIATAMEPAESGHFVASGYDEFVDHPIQLGKFIRKPFKVEGIDFEAIWVADPLPACNIDEETERLRVGSIPAIKMMGGAPFKSYKYFIHLEIGDFNGGLEHRASTVIAVANTRTIHLDDLATHEFYHSWNVKQMRPAVLGPFNYNQECRTGNLWFAEGVTDYYAKVHAYQAKFWNRSQYLSALENTIEELQYATNRLKMTIEECSRNAWENGGFGVGDLSYYTKGTVIGFVMDAHIRNATKGKKSMDDVMRLVYEKYRLPNPGYGEDDLRSAMIEVGGNTVGPLYDTMVRSKNEVPYAGLEGIGLRLVEPGKTYVEPLYLLDESGSVTNATRSNLAGGIQDGDHVDVAKVVGESEIEVTVTRNKKQLKLRLPGRSYKAGDYRLQVNPFATAEQKLRLAEWSKRD